jgi:hypothetical protein
MAKLRWAVLVVGLCVLGGGSVGQDKKKDDPKKDDVKKDEPVAKPKGFLPPYWKDIVSEDQKPKIYTVQAKYREKIEKLEAEIKALKDKRDKEMLEILSPEQKKRLEDKIKEKAGLKKDD